VPQAAVSDRSKAVPLFDYLVGEQLHRIGNREAQRLRSLEIDLTNSNLVDRCTGRSAGFSSLTIRPALIPAWRNESATD